MAPDAAGLTPEEREFRQLESQVPNCGTRFMPS